MIIVYDLFKLNLPSSWKSLNVLERKQLGVSEEAKSGVKCLDAFLDESSNIILLQSYGEANGFLEEYVNTLDKLCYDILKKQKVENDWKASKLSKPLFYNYGRIGESEVVVSAIQPYNNEEINVIQVFFSYKSNVFCFNYTIKKGIENFEMLEKEKITTVILNLIKEIDEDGKA